MPWTVLVDIPLRRLLEGWDVGARMQLDALQRLLRDKGPAVLDWDARRLTGYPSWDEVQGSYRCDVWLPFEDDFVRVTLEVLPGRTAVIRPAD
jgi:hypothetical protein